MPVSFSGPESPEAASDCARLVSACLRRFLVQNEKPALPEPELAGLGTRFWRAVAREASRPPAGVGEWREMPVELGENLAEEILGHALTRDRRADLDVPVRQLLKACLQAEPVRCRESYREVIGGHCRRQELGRARGRISGSHCVDCPHWIALDAGKNIALMERSWVEGPVAGLHVHRDVFLPENFRELRRWARTVLLRPIQA